MRAKTQTAGLCLVLLLSTGLRAAGPEAAKDNPAEAPKPGKIAVEIKPQEARLGDPIELTIRVEPGEGGFSYELPGKLQLAGMEEISRSREEQDKDGKKIQILRVKAVAYEKVGELAVPEFALIGKGPADKTPPEVRVPELKVKIRSMLQGLEKPQPRDIANPEEVRVRDFRLLVALGLAAQWLLLALLLRLQQKRASVPERRKELPPPRRAHEIALEKLERIVEENLLRQGRVQEFFYRISEAVREYVGNRYGFYALDLTSRELLEELRDRHTPGLEHGSLSQLLSDADLVKFARQNPSDETCSRTLNSAFALVEATRIQEFKDEVKESA